MSIGCFVVSGYLAGGGQVRAVQRLDQVLAGLAGYEVAQAAGSTNLGHQQESSELVTATLRLQDH